MRVLTSALVLLALVAAPTAAAAPRLGIYDCVGSESGYVNSVKLSAGGKYLWALRRKNAALLHATAGTYRVAGNRISWLSGTYKRGGYVSTYYPKGYFSIDGVRGKVWTGISCYWQRDPQGTRG